MLFFFFTLVMPPSVEVWTGLPGCACVCLQLLSYMTLFSTPWTVAHQAPLSMGFSWQEYWSELPFPPLGDLPDSGIEPVSLVLPALQADSLPLSHQGSPGKSLKIFLFIHIYTLWKIILKVRECEYLGWSCPSGFKGSGLRCLWPSSCERDFICGRSIKIRTPICKKHQPL